MLKNKSPWIAAVALSLVGCGMEPLPPDISDSSPSSTEQPAVTTQSIPIERVPRELHRRAAQLLEDVRGTESAPTWETATLAPTVRPLYRPDISSVAYYEFRVLVRQQPMGFIIVSAGTHDHPIAHWNFEGLSPTEELILEAGSTASRFYKVDSLTYVAESAGGELVAKLGELPPRLVGHDPAVLNTTLPTTEVTWSPTVPVPDDSQASSVTYRKQVSGPVPTTNPFQMAGWASWQELKTNYSASYGTLAESLKREAAEEWEPEILAREGEGLVVDRPLEVALLYPLAGIQLDGEGSRLVRHTLVTTPSGGQKLVLTAFSARPGAEVPLTVQVSYANGVAETLPFAVLALEDVGSPEDPAPQLDASKPQGSGSVHWTDMGKMGTWSPWTEYFAGTHGQQRLYDQLDSGSGPNKSSCTSGCGATAWAMLLGWGDAQAALGTPGWTKYWGLYRANGGYGADAVAPKTMDAGVSNMTWEIRNAVGTFCHLIHGAGATYPWKMDNVDQYLKNRSAINGSIAYSSVGIHKKDLRNRARNSIVDRKVPAIIGTGWLEHYPLAYGYRTRERTVKKLCCWTKTEVQRQFYVNQGWGGYKNGWINASTWFAGQLFP